MAQGDNDDELGCRVQQELPHPLVEPWEVGQNQHCQQKFPDDDHVQCPLHDQVPPRTKDVPLSFRSEVVR